MTVRSLALLGGLLVAATMLGCAQAAPAEDPFAEQSPPPPIIDVPTRPGYVGLIDEGWAERTAAATGIPQLALLAYAGAVIRSEEAFPGCSLGWNTIAAIGFIESDHGRYGGAQVGDDFRAVPEIFGVVLDGGDTLNIPDSDGGAVDGISDYDRAVGPMQLIPQTWASFPSDGNGDGIPDPHNIADAAIAAANYLCRAVAGDMSNPDGWRTGIAAYNTATSYAGKIAEAANRYRDAAD
jgi:membrane-bound lytic murein transglycosylase B